MVAQIYRAVDRRLWTAAGHQVRAYLDALEREGRVSRDATETYALRG